jgi:hypothetical protein
MSHFSVDIDADDFLAGCTRFERMEIFDQLSEEFGNEEGPLSGAVTPMETDLREVILEIWDKRNLLTMEQREQLINLSRASVLSA